jgi:uracil-DNA glycosylase family 4
VTEAERRIALEQIAAEVRGCTRCRLHEHRNRAVPGEGNPDTEVVFVGEGPGFNEDQEGRPFVGRAGGLLVRLLASIGWRREDVFITNVVKCRPPDNRDPQPDEIAACAPYLRRQLEALDPALVVTLGRYSMGTFMPGARISQAHGTIKAAPPETGARDALAFAMYHPAAALRATEIERASFVDMAAVPPALLDARARREQHAIEVQQTEPATAHEVKSMEIGTTTVAIGTTTVAIGTTTIGAIAPGSADDDGGLATNGDLGDMPTEAWTVPPSPAVTPPPAAVQAPPPPATNDVPSDQLTLF